MDTVTILKILNGFIGLIYYRRVCTPFIPLTT